MKAQTRRDIPVILLRGSVELGRATGFTDKRIHAKWREAGLAFSVGNNRTFLYDPKDVTAFIKRYYAPQKVKKNPKADV